MASEYGGDRRAAMQARNELYLKGPWAAAELIHQLYQHTEVRLVPAMVLRQSYKAVPQMAREVELGAAPSGAKYP